MTVAAAAVDDDDTFVVVVIVEVAVVAIEEVVVVVVELALLVAELVAVVMEYYDFEMDLMLVVDFDVGIGSFPLTMNYWYQVDRPRNLSSAVQNRHQ